MENNIKIYFTILINLIHVSHNYEKKEVKTIERKYHIMFLFFKWTTIHEL